MPSERPREMYQMHTIANNTTVTVTNAEGHTLARYPLQIDTVETIHAAAMFWHHCLRSERRRILSEPGEIFWDRGGTRFESRKDIWILIRHYWTALGIDFRWDQMRCFGCGKMPCSCHASK